MFMSFFFEENRNYLFFLFNVLSRQKLLRTPIRVYVQTCNTCLLYSVTSVNFY